MRDWRNWADVAIAVFGVAVAVAVTILGLLMATLMAGVLVGEIATVWGALL